MSLLPRCLRRGATGRPRARVRREATAAALMAAALVTLAACGGGASAQTAPPSTGESVVGASTAQTVYGPKGPAAPAVSGTTLTGARLSLSQFRGHVLVMNFWGSWCTECRAEAHTFALLSRQYSAAGVKFLGVDIRDSVASAQGYMHDFGITYPSLFDPGSEVALDFRSTVPPSAIPTTLVISASGRIEARVLGTVSYQGLRNLISMALS